MSEVKSCSSRSSSRFSSSSVLFERNEWARRLDKYAMTRNPNELLRNHIRSTSQVGAASDVCGIFPSRTSTVKMPSEARQHNAVTNAASRLNKMLATMITSKNSDVK